MSATSWTGRVLGRAADWAALCCGRAKRRQSGEVHEDVERGDEQDGENDGARDGALGLANFSAEERDVVIAPITIGSEQRGLGEAAERKCGGERGSLRHVPAAGGCGVGESGDDDAGEGGDDSGEEHPGETRDGSEIAIEERGDEKARGGGGEVGVVERGKSGDWRRIEIGPEKSEKTREADAARGDGERRSEADLPDVEKTEPVAGAAGAVDLLEESVAAAGARKGCAELGPDEAVGDGDDCAEDPSPDGEAIASGGNDEGQSDEGADADHLEHVEEDGGAKADAALECGGLEAGLVV